MLSSHPATKNCANNVVIIDYEDLLSDPEEPSSKVKLYPLLTRAFGSKTYGNSNSVSEPSPPHPPPLGLIAIRNIPTFVSKKQKLFQKIFNLATLPQDYLEGNLTDAKSLYNAGWSHGKEKLGRNATPDLSKASFYFNPITDVPGTEEERDLYPASYPCNIWPDESVTPGFEDCAKSLGCLMKDVVVLLARHIDVFVSDVIENSDESKRKLVKIGAEMEKTEKVKGRILYYFPLDIENGSAEEKCTNKTTNTITKKEDSWIGWHNDSGFLTALAGDAYIDHTTGKILDKKYVDPSAGLHVMDRNGTVVKVDIPEDCMGIQIGECLQIVTGGAVVATPHCVRGADPYYKYTDIEDENNLKVKNNVARISFPCFIDTIPSFPLSVPGGCKREDVIKSTVRSARSVDDTSSSYSIVPPLEDRWVKDGMEFGVFLQKTFAMYYDWSLK